ncbi:MAG: PAS domain-containing protein [Magnetococcales bacterium]|nr:PAS domain-containing protein [Magnetococcales bacterium]
MMRDSANKMFHVAREGYQALSRIKENLNVLQQRPFQTKENLDHYLIISQKLDIFRWQVLTAAPKLSGQLADFSEAQPLLEQIKTWENKKRLEYRFAHDIAEAERIFEDLAEGYLKRALAASEGEIQQLNHTAQWVKRLMPLTLVLTGLMGALLGWWLISRHITRRLERVSRCLQEPDAEQGVKQLPLAGSDEIAAMAHAVRRFIQDRHKLEQMRGMLETKTHDHQLTSDALSQSEIRFRTLFESSSDAVMLLDQTVILDCNTAAPLLFPQHSQQREGRWLEER